MTLDEVTWLHDALDTGAGIVEPCSCDPSDIPDVEDLMVARAIVRALVDRRLRITEQE